MKIDTVVTFLRPLFMYVADYPWYFALLAFMTLDIVSGALAAFVTKTLNSKVGWTGLFKKVGTLVLVTVAAILDPLLDAGGIVSKWTVLGFVAVEALSILENCGRMGIITPVILKNALETLNSKQIVVNSQHTDIQMPTNTIIGGKRANDPQINDLQNPSEP